MQRGQSCSSFFFFSIPSPQTTFESTDMTGSTFLHVLHKGSGFPSGPFGGSWFLGFDGKSFGSVGWWTERSEGLARRTRVSTSSCLILTLPSFSFPLADLVGVETEDLLGGSTALLFPLTLDGEFGTLLDRVVREEGVKETDTFLEDTVLEEAATSC